MGPHHLYCTVSVSIKFTRVASPLRSSNRPYANILCISLHPAMGLLQLAVTWYVLEGKLPTGASKTKKIQIYLEEVALFWMSQWAACPPACTM